MDLRLAKLGTTRTSATGKKRCPGGGARRALAPIQPARLDLTGLLAQHRRRESFKIDPERFKAMPRVVPSLIVQIIDRMFDWAAKEEQQRALGQAYADRLAAIVDLLEQVPSELVTLDGPEYAALVAARATITDILLTWQSGAERAPGFEWTLDDEMPGFAPLSPVSMIRRCLAKCPDEAPPPGTTELAYIADMALRESIRLDISAGYRNLAEGQWKGATVLAGSGIEALLLWAIQDQEQKKSGTLAAAVAALLANKSFDRNPGLDPEGAGWHLHPYVEVAEYLKLIKPATATLVRLAKDFRNLIHPGKAKRVGQKCDRSTALGALAAVEAVARDLTPP